MSLEESAAATFHEVQVKKFSKPQLLQLHYVYTILNQILFTQNFKRELFNLVLVSEKFELFSYSQKGSQCRCGILWAL